MDQPYITFLIIGLTSISSIMAFNNPAMMGSALFFPFAIRERREWHRFITSGFVHADFMHLLVNMFVLYSFGKILELYYFPALFHDMARIAFVALYVLALIISDIPSYFKHRFDATYRGLGASGAVAAIVFACILIEPWPGEGRGIYLFLIPVAIPPIIFGVVYLIYSAYMGKYGKDNVNHDAHFYGSVVGFAFPLLFKPELFMALINQIKDKI